MRLSKGGWISLLVILLLVTDQVIKFAVKLNMTIGESIPVFGNWFQICFIENNGMAFGMQFGGSIGKLALSLFRVVLIGFLIVYLRRLIKRTDTPTGVLVGLALVLVGAIGNVIDCLFYGEIFSASTYTQVAQLFPPDGGYTSFLYGKVVDMFYFPIIDTNWPEWMPFVGGEHFIFFSPIFNFADAAISCGIIALILFYSKYLNSIMENHPNKQKES